MKRHTTILTTALLLVLLATPLLAGEKIDEARDVNGDAVVSIENLAGSITIVGWDRDRVEITGTLDRKAEKLEIEGGRDNLEIRVKYPKKKNLNIKKGSVLELKVPENCRLQVEGVSCDIDVSRFHGRIEAGTVSGDVHIVGDTRGIEAGTVSGDVMIESQTDAVEVSTVSGFIEVKGVRKELEIDLVSGGAEVHGGELEHFTFNVVSGDLDVYAAPARGADWEISGHSGDITLHLPADLDAEFDIGLFSGDLHNDFGPKARRTDKYAPGKELRFTAGDGGADIEISTFSGDIRLVRR